MPLDSDIYNADEQLQVEFYLAKEVDPKWDGKPFVRINIPGDKTTIIEQHRTVCRLTDLECSDNDVFLFAWICRIVDFNFLVETLMPCSSVPSLFVGRSIWIPKANLSRYFPIGKLWRDHIGCRKFH